MVVFCGLVLFCNIHLFISSHFPLVISTNICSSFVCFPHWSPLSCIPTCFISLYSSIILYLLFPLLSAVCPVVRFLVILCYTVSARCPFRGLKPSKDKTGSCLHTKKKPAFSRPSPTKISNKNIGHHKLDSGIKLLRKKEKKRGTAIWVSQFGLP